MKFQVIVQVKVEVFFNSCACLLGSSLKVIFHLFAQKFILLESLFKSVADKFILLIAEKVKHRQQRSWHLLGDRLKDRLY